MRAKLWSTLAVVALYMLPACTGPAGVDGGMGPPGATGAAGATGATGPAGTNGAAGANGKNGATGPTGANGSPGANGTAGATGATGATGLTGATGPTGGTASTMGTISVTVNDGNGDGGVVGALANVLVTAETTAGAPLDTTGGPTGLIVSATTGATGTAALSLPYGAYDLTFTLTGYATPAPVLVGVVPLQQVAIAVTMNEASSSKPSLTLVAAGTNLGYGNSTTVTATASSPLGNALTYTWAPNSLVVGSGNTATVTTPTMATAMARVPDPSWDGGVDNWNLGNFVSGYAIPNTFGKLPISNDVLGAVSASLTVSDAYGQSATASVSVQAASPQNPTQAAVVGTRVFLNSGNPAMDGGVTWTLSVPTGSSATFDHPASAYPSFIPDLTGKYVATLGTQSLPIYVGSWVGVVDNNGSSTSEPTTGTVPFVANTNCTVCHNSGPTAMAIDEFTPWMSTSHAIKLTYYLTGQIDPETGAAGYSGQGCLACHSLGYDMGNKFSMLAGGMSGAEMDAGYSVPSTFNVKNWDNMPAQVSRYANIQCENCHGPQGDPSAPGGFSTGHELTDVSSGNHQPFQSPRISYAAEVCAQCHAASTSHHDYSEWATLNPDDGRGHSNLAIAQSEGLSGSPLPDGGYQLNSSCGRCHTAQGFTEYVANLEAGNVGSLAPTQLGAGEINPSNVQPQTCAACHDPHQNQIDPVTGDEEHQLRLYGSIPLLPAGFGVSEMGAGAVCIACHNSRNGGYNPNASTNAESAAYLHEDSDPIGSNPASASATLAQGTTKFSTLGGPHEANQGDVFEGHNAYFLNDQTPIISPHSAVVDTCVGCHMINNPNATIKSGARTPEMHIFAIQNAAAATLCNSCHGNGNSNVDGASLQASVVAGLANIITNMNTAVTERINDSAGTYKAPSGYGTWVDTGTITIAAKGLTDTTAGCTLATDVSCGLANSATVTIVAAPGSATGANALVSAVASPQGRSGMNVILTFANPVSISFKGASGTVSNTLTSFTVNMADLGDANGNRLFVETGNLYKANWNYTLIQQDKSNGVHNPPFVSAVLGATADPWGNPNATPPQPGGLWY